MKDLDIYTDDKTIEKYPKSKWKALVKKAIKQSALLDLTSEKSNLKNTKEISFDELKSSEYLLDNRSTSLSKIIFSLRSKTFDIKE